MRRHELSDEEWAVIEPLLPNNSRGIERVDDRRMIKGVLERARPGEMCQNAMVAHDALQSVLALAQGWRLGPAS